MKTIHIILNAHIDPIWLWPWQAGLDSVIATCRSACDRLDAHADIFFTRGEAWVYDQIEQVDPDLFTRIRKHVQTGRWNIIGGWWIQPDCNLPSGFAMRKQIELGKEFFMDRFGIFPKTAYNVDSFGHAATLPGLMREAGQSRYVMMRPGTNEMTLPARVFRWRGYADGPEVTTFRIAGAYCTGAKQNLLDHLKHSTTELPQGIDQTMCFIGVGDHGGGPTEQQIAFLHEHADGFDGWRLQFSTPDKFFDAIAAHHDALPMVTGELQLHAIGCYSVYRPIKTNVRRAEHLVARAQIAGAIDPSPRADTPAKLQQAWRQVCFHHFHDTYGGTCIPSAYVAVMDQLGQAASIADEILQHSLRRRISALPPDPMQRMVLFNASEKPYSGYVTAEPWLGWQRLDERARLLAEDGGVVPHQVFHAEALANGLGSLVFKVNLAPGEIRAVRIDTTAGPPPAPVSTAHADQNRIHTDTGIAVAEKLRFPAGTLELPRLESINDPTDTWSHDIDRYGETPAKTAEFADPILLATGPLMAAMVRNGSIGDSRLRAEWRVYADDPFIELRLRIHWAQRHEILKMALPLPTPVDSRIDGIMDGQVQRSNDSVERPLRDWTLIPCGGKSLGIVSPDVFAIDVSPQRVRMTLLRSALMAHHVPNPPEELRGVYSDQGVHEFRIWFILAADVTPAVLEQRAMCAHRPPLYADLTRGMPTVI
jgi:alpha-mannosidase